MEAQEPMCLAPEETHFKKYNVGVGDVAQLVDCLPSMHEALALMPRSTTQTVGA